MKIALLLVTTFFFFLQGVALDDGIGKRAKRLVTYFERTHLQPRTLDAEFGQDLNSLLTEYLDENKHFFLASDIQLLDNAAKMLHIEIDEEKIDYLNLFERLFIERANEAKKYIEELLKDPSYALTITGKISASDNYPSNREEFEQRWRETIAQSIQELILDELDEDETLDDLDLEASCILASEKVLQTFQDYFSAVIDTESYFELTYINCIAWCYDPHSNYFNENIKKEFTEELSSERRLFGISYQKNTAGKIEITGITPGSSAWYTDGISTGDELVYMSSEGDGVDVSDASTADIRSFFDDLTSDTITITLISDGIEKEVTLVKNVVYSDGDIIKAARLEGDQNIGYISLPDFYTNWTDTSSLGCANDVAKSLLRLKKSGIDGLILDLRDNGGGSIKEAIDLVGIFINYGPVLIEQEQKGKPYTHKDFNRGSIYRGPLVVLVNSNSASASEIVAAALQDYNRGLIVGQTSYGKATGQIIEPLDPKYNEITRGFIQEDPDWGYGKVTRIGLYRINKKSAQMNGVKPDIALVNLSFDDPDYERDLPHTIVLDSVDKKVYFSPKSALPVSSIQSYYDGKKEATLGKLKLLSDSIKQRAQDADNELSLKLVFEQMQILDKLFNRYEDLEESINYAFKPVSFQFRESVLRMSPFLVDYNKRFVNRLESDIELNEAYKIIQGLIQSTQ